MADAPGKGLQCARLLDPWKLIRGCAGARLKVSQVAQLVYNAQHQHRGAFVHRVQAATIGASACALTEKLPLHVGDDSQLRRNAGCLMTGPVQRGDPQRVTETRGDPRRGNAE
ncbi:hypothetical protein ACN47E_010297 [Coniothyrium glycines]